MITHLIKTKVNAAKNPNFLGYLHSFRGLAILIIVLGHAVVAAFIGAYGAFDETAPILMVSEIFYHDSTLYFAIISGLLFSKVLKPKGYYRFYKNKLKHIVLPYLVVTLVLTLIKIKFYYVYGFQESIVFYFSNVIKNLIFGKANFALWYIPVLIFLYFVTPILEFLQKKNQLTKVLFFLILVMPLIVSRVQVLTEYVLSMETMLYFMGAYAFGMYLGTDLDEKLQLIKKYKKIIAGIAIISTAVLFYFYYNEIDMIGKVSLKESFFYIQKIGFALILLMLFKRLDDNQPQWLNPIATGSFFIYFIHASILYAITPLFLFILHATNFTPLNVVVAALILLLVTIGISMLFVQICNKLFGNYSRMIIGA